MWMGNDLFKRENSIVDTIEGVFLVHTTAYMPCTPGVQTDVQGRADVLFML